MFNGGLQPTSPTQYAGGSVPRECLPNFLLSPTGAASGASPSGGASVGANTTSGQGGISYGAPGSTPALSSPSFNERLRPSSVRAGSGAPSTVGDGRGSVRRPTTPGSTSASARKPPTRSLLDSGPGVVALHSPSPVGPASGLVDSRPRGTPGTTMPRTPLTPGVTAGSVDTERWITVFGFPAAMEALVLRDLRRHGEVVRTLGGRGNWMHVMYRTPMQASVAAHRPWRLVAGGSTMIGLTWCTEPELVAAAEREGDGPGVIVASPTPSAGSGHGTPIMMAGMPAMPVGSSSALRTPKSVVRGGVASGAIGASPMDLSDSLTGASPMDLSDSLTGFSRTPMTGPSPGPASIMRTPEPQRGLLSYITDFMSGEAR